MQEEMSFEEFMSMSEEERNKTVLDSFYERMDEMLDVVFMERKSFALTDILSEKEIDEYIVKKAEEKKAKYENYTKKDIMKVMLLNELMDAMGDDEDETQIS